MIKLSERELAQAAAQGEKAAAEALSVLSKLDVRVNTQQQEIYEGDRVKGMATDIDADSVSAYTQAITGLKGASVLTMNRKDALTMVDLFNNREPGTTVVMNEMDRSTIKETLNILSNSYVVELAKLKDVSIMLSVPRMVTKANTKELLESVGESASQVLMFETSLEVADKDFEVKLSFFFLTANA